MAYMFFEEVLLTSCPWSEVCGVPVGAFYSTMGLLVVLILLELRDDFFQLFFFYLWTPKSGTDFRLEFFPLKNQNSSIQDNSETYFRFIL